MDPISNRQLTLARKLLQKKYRSGEGLFLIEGERAVQQVIENEKIRIKELIFDQRQQLWQHPGWHKAIKQFSAVMADEGDFHSVTDTGTPQGVVAVAHIPDETDIDVLASKEGIIVALDRIRDPGNLGTILRSAAWFGVVGILSGSGTVDAYHPKVVRSTAGATGAVPLCNAILKEAFERLESKGWEIVLLDAGEAARELKSIKGGKRMVITTGNEAHGIDADLFGPGRVTAKISGNPDSKNVESLNASIALSIALYGLQKK